LVLIQDNKNWYIGLTINCDDKLHIVTQNEINNANKTIINIRMKWYNTSLKTKIIKETGTNYIYSINNSTKAFLESQYGTHTKTLPIMFDAREV